MTVRELIEKLQTLNNLDKPIETRVNVGGGDYLISSDFSIVDKPHAVNLESWVNEIWYRPLGG